MFGKKRHFKISRQRLDFVGNLRTETVVFTGNVVIEQPRGTMTGQQVTYNLQTGQVNSGGETGGGRVKMRIMPKTGAAAAKGSQG